MNLLAKKFDELHTGELYEILKARAEVFILEQNIVKIGRVLTLDRGKGLGMELMKQSMEAMKERMKCRKICMDAQRQAAGFYEKLGFQIVSDEFLEEGIVHVRMEAEV